MHEASLYDKLPGSDVRCGLCAHRCTISEGKRGVCHVRENRDGILYTLVYGRTIARNVDPIEKKPLYHFMPGTHSYSIATAGCNFRCPWCQNADISQMPRERHLVSGERASPDEIVDDAQRTGCRSISYTYTEPTVFFEYTHDTAQLARAAGLANVYVTNGYMTPEMLEILHPYLDAANVDLKAFRDQTYKKHSKARLQPVLDSLRTMKQYRIHIEVTTLLIPAVNDDPQELKDLATFLARDLGRDTPWHISRFFPNYQMSDVPPTPPETLQRAKSTGIEAGLRFVYLGNIAAPDGGNTFCPSCGSLVVERMGYRTHVLGLEGSRCNRCGTELNFIR